MVYHCTIRLNSAPLSLSWGLTELGKMEDGLKRKKTKSKMTIKEPEMKMTCY